MKPIRTLLFILCVFLILILLSWAIPAGGFRMAGVHFEFPKISEWINPTKVEYADITKIIADTSNLENATKDSSISDIPDSLFAQTIAEILHPLQGKDSPCSALWPFYEKLISNPGLIRVMHFGDSQIEGDRMTGYLRQKFQERFGGSGVGYLPPVQVANVALPVELVSIGDWKRYPVYGKCDTTVHHKKYGFAGAFSKFSPLIPDTTQRQAYEAAIVIKPSSASYKSAFQFNSIKILCGNITKPLITELTVDGLPADMKITTSYEGLSTIELPLSSDANEIKLEFTSECSPDFYGILLNKNEGIAFDNIPMRGSSGTDFTRMDFNLLSQIIKNENVGMLIYQFGVNVVPVEHDDYTFYENWVYSQLSFLKKLAPDMCILVVGVSDMSKKSGEQYISYPNIVKIRDAQKKAAFRAGCAFWDMFEAMGGENSMPSWVNAEPSLASPDYTHFNSSGARIIARMLYKAMMSDYETYMRKRPKNQANS